MFEKQKATSVTGTQRTKGRLEAFEGVKPSRLWLGFNCVLSGSGGQNVGSTVRLIFCRDHSGSTWRARGQGPGLVETC